MCLPLITQLWKIFVLGPSLIYRSPGEGYPSVFWLEKSIVQEVRRNSDFALTDKVLDGQRTINALDMIQCLEDWRCFWCKDERTATHVPPPLKQGF